MSTHAVARTTPILQTVSFGTQDGKGRELGANILTWNAGGKYAVEVHATRGLVPYGASQYPTYYATLEARDQYIASYLTGARKRALKNFPPASTCQLCGEPKPADRSCDCFDNHCQ